MGSACGKTVHWTHIKAEQKRKKGALGGKFSTRLENVELLLYFFTPAYHTSNENLELIV